MAVHALLVKLELKGDTRLWNALLVAFLKLGFNDYAYKVFDCMCCPDVVSFTSLVSSFAKSGWEDKAVEIFVDMISLGVEANEYSYVGILSACIRLGSLSLGSQVHGLVVKLGYLDSVYVSNALLGLCGRMSDAEKMFRSRPLNQCSSVIWTSMICGYARNGQPYESISLFCQGFSEGTMAVDEVLSAAVLGVCGTLGSPVFGGQIHCHAIKSGFLSNTVVENAIMRYNLHRQGDLTLTAWEQMQQTGFWGHLKEAEEVIISMSIKPEASVWRALLDSCRIHMETDIGERAAKQILSLEPLDPSTYILMSNLFSSSGRWHCSEMIRGKMREKGFRKRPVQSWIFHQDRAHFFFTRDKSHSQSKDINKGLEILVLECLKAGYVPDTSFVLHEVEEYQKKDFLFYHSAKLAVTYGLLMTEPEKPIRVMKNVILCGDCHTFFKYVSVVTKREIHVRDSSGFHCFWNVSLTPVVKVEVLPELCAVHFLGAAYRILHPYSNLSPFVG
ncbi:hypothetical protein POM88_043659 [Heracleum sosnowskyi]|uniref:DYW domain-containing protein n=1 Tax=Heracleum sosnowskyi TaxID=360622 RepID=A0AAD8H3W9_9APIA|nr:hypothetical protein POM88_043659 [Heracleum sosnowskyi]